MEKKKEIDEILDQLTRWFEKNEKKRTVMLVVSDDKEDFQVSRFVLGMLKYIECGIMTENLEYKICEHIREDEFSKELSDCLEINDFYIQVENGKDIITLNRLRMLYVNFYEELEDYQFESEDIKTKLREYLCQIINTLSRLMYTIHGSKQCQKF